MAVTMLTSKQEKWWRGFKQHLKQMPNGIELTPHLDGISLKVGDDDKVDGCHCRMNVLGFKDLAENLRLRDGNGC